MSQPRRSSYASVVSGNLGSSTGPRSGLLAHLSEGASASSSTPHHRSRNAPQSKSESQIDTLGNLQHDRWSTTAGDMGESTSNTFDPWPDFFFPSYLKDSRHMEKLEERYKARLAAQREGKTGRSTVGSLSRSSSGANLHKMVPSHRGMTHEIIERPLQRTQEEQTLADIPTRWSAADKFQGIEVATDGSEAKFMGCPKQGYSNEGSAVRADRPIPKEIGLFYFEITVLSRGRERLVPSSLTTEAFTNRMIVR